MINKWQKIKKVIIVLIFINCVSAVVLLNKTDLLMAVFSPQAAIAEGNGKKEAKKGETAEAEKGNKPEESKKEAAAKQAEEDRLVFEGLELRRLQLKEKEENILREQEKLKILKQELEEKIAELEKIHSQISISLEKLDRKKSERDLKKEAEENKKIKQLVKVYSSMKPKNAGQIINNLDIIVAEKIIRNMKGEAAGKILSYVESSRAAAISERIATNVRKENQ